MARRSSSDLALSARSQSLGFLLCSSREEAVRDWFGGLLCRLMRFPPKEAIAVLIMSSQKTMPFAVSIIALLPASLGSKGLLTLPPLVAQVSFQIGGSCSSKLTMGRF